MKKKEINFLTKLMYLMIENYHLDKDFRINDVEYEAKKRNKIFIKKIVKQLNEKE